MNHNWQIRFHARSGQGAKTAAHFLAVTALEQGMEFQAFSEYSADRTGAPMRTFCRISDKPIRTHEPVINPDIVVVLDPSLMDIKDITEGIKEGGMLLVNSNKDADYFREKTGFNGTIHTLNATKISMDITCKNFPNLPMLGAMSRVSEIISLRTLKDTVKKAYVRKFDREFTDKTLRGINRGYEEVR
ncbi:2-oxoacid:acceptor oxidoreductase family protein [Candidatus Woesearchaeota archaeon]|nr:2-oxoacid:acceptor oxidoreductase family protein [Candidatus Woesearchaeota archaeon]MBW3014275.1 2-oxoacid:acceptor oxidoreductase family protein [Candidatus Woesearchaeota archaeon]